MVGELKRCSNLKDDDEKIVKRLEKKEKKRRSREVASRAMIIKSMYEYELNDKSFYIYFSNKYEGGTRYLCRIPATWLSCTTIIPISNNEVQPSLNFSFNHSLHHKEQPLFTLPEPMSLSVRHEFNKMGTCMNYTFWGVIGSTMYFFGCRKKGLSNACGIYYLTKNSVFTFGPSSFSGKRRALKSAGCMINGRENAKVVSLDGKAYVFGGYFYDEDNEPPNLVWAEVFEPYEGSLKGRCRALSSPSPSYECDPYFVVAVEKSKKIVVLWEDNDMYLYDIVADAWVQIDIDFLIPNRPLCAPVHVDGILYWLDYDMVAYDLENKIAFHGPIEDLLIQTCLENSHPDESLKFNVSLLHLAGDLFCIVWVEEDKPKIMHCTTAQILRDAAGKESNLRTIVLSCQTFVSQFALELEGRVLMF